MSDRFALLLATATFALPVASSAVQARVPSASGPRIAMVFDDSRSIVTTRRPASDGVPVDAAAPQPIDRAAEDRAVLARDSFDPPLQEAKQLGAPRGVLGARASSARDDAPPTTLRALDPRTNEFTKVVGALAIVLGLVVLFRTLVRRLGGPLAGGGRPSGVVEVLARYPLAKSQHLVLLKLGRRIVLLHQTKVSMSAITEVSDPDEVASLLVRI